jgi:hypothetical protein
MHLGAPEISKFSGGCPQTPLGGAALWRLPTAPYSTPKPKNFVYSPVCELSHLHGSAANTICAADDNVPAVGPTLLLNVSIEGLPVKATVDTGTIISHSTLHAIGCHLNQIGRPLPTLLKPTVRLYGKDGPVGGRQLTITAQLPLTFTVDCESVNVLTFVQPDSEQPCLLGMNAIPSLGITVL